MLYLIDDYIAEFPYRQIHELLRFNDCRKYLHEMTLDEVNKIVSEWNPVSSKTTEVNKRKIAQYLEWLANKGIEIAFDISKIQLPTKKNSSEFIFSSDDIHRCYNILYAAIERKNTLDGTGSSTQIFKMTHAAGILAYYGLSDEQILDLDLSDVQQDGVKGYDLPLTQEDINVLLDYKNMQIYDNNNVLKGVKYIRTRASDGKSTDSYFLNRPISKAVVEEKYAYVKTLLKTSQLNLFGKFDRAYCYEKKSGDKIDLNGRNPEWFKDIFRVSPNWLKKMREQFIEYRNARDENEIAKKSANSDIIAKLNDISAQILKLNKEAEELRKQLL